MDVLRVLLSVRAKVLHRKCREGFFKLGIVGVKEELES